MNHNKVKVMMSHKKHKERFLTVGSGFDGGWMTMKGWIKGLGERKLQET